MKSMIYEMRSGKDLNNWDGNGYRVRCFITIESDLFGASGIKNLSEKKIGTYFIKK